MKRLAHVLRRLSINEPLALHLARAQEFNDTANLIRADAREVWAAGDIETAVTMVSVVVGMRHDAQALTEEWSV